MLHDVVEILAIPIEGRSCSVDRAYTFEDQQASLANLFGLDSICSLSAPYLTGRKAPVVKSNSVIPEALEAYCREHVLDEHKAIGWLMYLLGSTVFVDKSGDRIWCATYPLLSSIESVGEYA